MNIFEFSEYRVYLRSWLEEAKRSGIINLSRLSSVVQVHPTFLSQVLRGKKDLSLEQAALLSHHLGHTKLEREFFFVLIQLERAGNPQLKEHWLDKKAELQVEKNKMGRRFDRHRQLTSEQRATYYSRWIYSAVRISTAIQGGQTLDQVAERFRLTREQAEEILTFLAKAGLCSERNGVFSIGDMHVHLPNESPLVVKHHTNWRLQGIQRMDRRESDELFLTAPMSISQKDFARIREKLNMVIKEVVEIAKASDAEDVICVQLDFFRCRP